MGDISRAALFGKLDAPSYKAVEGATVFCKLRGNPYVELVHWLHQVLQLQNSDLHCIVRALGLDAGRLAQDLTASLDRLPRGPYVLASNHLSWVDPFLLLGWLPASPRVHFLGRRAAIYNRRWKRWVLGFMGGIIPVDSGEIRHLSVAVRGVLEHGGVAAIFPEGAVGKAEGVLQPLRRGVPAVPAG